jgi:hypothetical protein
MKGIFILAFWKNSIKENFHYSDSKSLIFLLKFYSLLKNFNPSKYKFSQSPSFGKVYSDFLCSTNKFKRKSIEQLPQFYGILINQ